MACFDWLPKIGENEIRSAGVGLVAMVYAWACLKTWYNIRARAAERGHDIAYLNRPVTCLIVAIPCAFLLFLAVR